MASRNVVMPCLRIASSAARADLTSSPGVGVGICLVTRSCAESSRSPVGFPAGSRQILPPSGACVAALMPASSMAREFDQRRMAEGRHDEDRPLGLERIQSRPRRLDTGGNHALLEPVNDLEPAVRLARARLIETRLDPRPASPRRSIGRSSRLHFSSAAPPSSGCMCPSTSPGHQHASVQIDLPGVRTDQGRGAGIAPDVDDAAVADGQCLLHAVPRIHGVHEPVAIHDVRRPRIRGRPDSPATAAAGAAAPCGAAALACRRAGQRPPQHERSAIPRSLASNRI